MSGTLPPLPPPATAPRPTGGPRRALYAGVVLVGLAALFVGLPLAILSLFASHGVTTPASALPFVAGGIGLALLFALAYYFRPTTWFGPVLIARAVGGILYLLLLAPFLVAHATVAGNVVATLGASALFLWLIASPAIGAVAGVFVWLSDARDPATRLRREFPA